MTLYEQTAAFLRAEGWEVSLGDRGPSSIVGSREELGGTNYVTVWCPSPHEMEHVRQWQPAMESRFAEAVGFPGNKILILDSDVGLKREFRDMAKAKGVAIKAPIEFFDRTFAWDDTAPSSRRGASAARKLRDNGDKVARVRVRQPYRDDAGNEGDDLLDELGRRFDSSVEWPRPVVLVTAPAGHGKTVLFQSLFSILHTHFHEAKKRGEKARRPLPLLPDHLGGAGTNRLPGLIDEFLRTDVAAPMSRDAFEWMLTNGYGAWLIDGLDEVIARDTRFFEYVEEVLLSADKVVTPRILLCVRDSLLSTSEGLRSLVGEVDGLVTRYELLPWKRPSIVNYARMRLTKVHDWRMVAWMDQRPQILKLCGTPYYANLVADRVEADPGTGLIDIPESDLVRDAIRAIVEREYTKDLRDSQVSVDNLLYMIGEAAVLQLQGAPLGIDVEQFSEVISVLLSDKDPNEQKAIAPQVLKLSVFSSATMRGRIRFTHDAVHEFLVAEQAVQYFGRDPGRFVELLNYAEFAPDSIALRIITNHIDSRGSGDEAVPLLYRARAGAHLTAFRNLVSIAVGLRDASALLADAPLTGLDLSGMTFANLALARVDLTSANLQSVTFDRCDLTGLVLVDAILDETRFVHCQSTLHAAEYGSMRGLMSVVVDDKRVDTSTAYVQMLRKAGRKAGATVDPCQTALRLRSLFKAMIGPDGRPRRKQRTSLVKGAATSASAELLDHAVRAGFVARVHGKASYECVKGQQYQGVVGYVRSLEPTPEITALLEGLCPIKGCTHIGL